MCGIAGFIGVSQDTKQVALTLSQALSHRGLDDSGIERPVPALTLIHTRLSIFDPSPAGHQPMMDGEKGNIQSQNWIIFNGAIYNYRELRQELISKGHQFHTKTDTEVILKAYRQWGEDCFERFRGMFALCLADLKRGVAVLARDRFGMKPLYQYSVPQGGFLFASEVKALLAVGPAFVPPKLNPIALESFLAQGAVQGEMSLIEGVTAQTPGTVVTMDLPTGKKIKQKSFWQFPVKISEQNDRKNRIEVLRSNLKESLKLHMVSDVPIGLFLSGGVDSTSLLALLSEFQTNGVKTLSIGFDVEEFDETQIAKIVSDKFHSDHHVAKLSQNDIVQEFPKILHAMDQPTVDGANTYMISQIASKLGFKVALSGLGGDELFGGYVTFQDVPRALFIRKYLKGSQFFINAIKTLKGGRWKKINEIYTHPANALSFYLWRRELFLDEERRRLHRLPNGCNPHLGITRELEEKLLLASKGFDPMNQISFFELQLYMRYMLLADSDVFSMAAPIEYRLPYLDHVFVESVFSLPGRWKKPDSRPKPLLLDLVGDQIPEVVYRRPKKGFQFPWKFWLRKNGPLSSFVDEAVNDSTVWNNLGLSPQAVQQTASGFLSGNNSISPLQILAFISLHHFSKRHKLCRN